MMTISLLDHLQPNRGFPEIGVYPQIIHVYIRIFPELNQPFWGGTPVDGTPPLRPAKVPLLPWRLALALLGASSVRWDLVTFNSLAVSTWHRALGKLEEAMAMGVQTRGVHGHRDTS